MAARRAVKLLTFYDGVLSALQVLYDFDGGCSVAYETVARCHGPLSELVAASKRAGNYTASGMREYVGLMRARTRAQGEGQ